MCYRSQSYKVVADVLSLYLFWSGSRTRTDRSRLLSGAYVSPRPERGRYSTQATATTATLHYRTSDRKGCYLVAKVWLDSLSLPLRFTRITSSQPPLSDARRLIAKAETLDNSGFMHPFSILTLGIFVAGYITARWDLVTRLYELAIFAWDHGVVVSASGFAQRLLPRVDVCHGITNVKTTELITHVRRHEQPKVFCCSRSSSSSWSFRSIILRQRKLNWYGLV